MLRDGRAIGHNTDGDRLRRELPARAAAAPRWAGWSCSARAERARPSRYALLRLGARRLVVVDLDADRAEALARRLDATRPAALDDLEDADGVDPRHPARHGRPLRDAAGRGSACARTCGSPTSSIARSRPSCCAAPAQRGCRTLDGGGMVVLQAAGSFERFTGVAPTASGCCATSRRWPSRWSGALIRRSIATVCLSGTLEEKLAAAAAAGFDGVELFETDLSTRRCAPATSARAPTSSGSRSTSTSRSATSRRLPAQPSATCAAPRPSSTSWSSSARRPSSCARTSPPTRSTTTRWPPSSCTRWRRRGRARAADRLRGAGVGPARQQFDHAWRIVAARRPPGARHLPGHLPHPLARHRPERDRAIPGEKIFFLQLADAPHMVMDVLQWSRHYRCFPGQGGARRRRRRCARRSPPATPARSRSRSSTTSSAPPTRSAWPSTRCARC